MDVAPALDPTSPRAAALYLLSLRPILAQAAGTHRSWIRALRGLVDDWRIGGPLVRERAQTIGEEWRLMFDEWRRELRRLDVPPPCATCDLEFGRWLEALIESCEAVHDAGVSGEFALLRVAHKRLTEARRHARAFNAEHANLIDELRELSDQLRGNLPVR